MSRLRADLLLLVAAVIWGTAFIAQKQANESMGPLSFVGARFLLSSMVLAPLALFENKRSDLTPLAAGDLRLAGFIGFCLFAGSSLQQIGLVTTSATNAGFLTALFVILVPLVVWAISGRRPRRVVMVAGLMSVAGAALLTGKGQFAPWSSGDVYILVADIAWAFAISLVPVFLDRADRPFFLAFAQYLMVAALGFVGGVGFERVSADGVAAALPAILYAGLFSGGVAFTLQIVAQKYTPAAEAALIMSLESVFAALAGALVLSERPTGLELLGCLLIFLGVIVVEAQPAIQNVTLHLRGRKKLSPAGE